MVRGGWRERSGWRLAAAAGVLRSGARARLGVGLV